MMPPIQDNFDWAVTELNNSLDNEYMEASS